MYTCISFQFIFLICLICLYYWHLPDNNILSLQLFVVVVYQYLQNKKQQQQKRIYRKKFQCTSLLLCRCYSFWFHLRNQIQYHQTINYSVMHSVPLSSIYSHNRQPKPLSDWLTDLLTPQSHGYSHIASFVYMSFYKQKKLNKIFLSIN